jgi:hypothetical protein
MKIRNRGAGGSVMRVFLTERGYDSWTLKAERGGDEDRIVAIRRGGGKGSGYHGMDEETFGKVRGDCEAVV